MLPAPPRRFPSHPALLLLAACAGGPGPGPATPSPAAAPAPLEAGAADTPPAPGPGLVAPLPAVPAVDGPLRLDVVYPAATDLVDVRDSTFLFGSTGTGAATLTVNGAPVRVWPNGAWLAWVAVPPDTLPGFTLIARTAKDSVTLLHFVHRVRRFRPPERTVWIDTTSLSPSGRVWWPADEYLPVSLRASEGATVRVRFPDGSVVPLVADAGPDEVSPGIRAFDRDTANLRSPGRADRYVGALRGTPQGGDPGPMLGTRPASCCGGRMAGGVPRCDVAGACQAASRADLVVEAILGADTARARWPLQLALLDSLPRLVEFNDDTAGAGNTDSLTVGRARPGATYHWFLPTGTRAVATGRLGDDLRIRLSRGAEAWVPAGDALPLPPGTPVLRATVGSVTLTPLADRLSLRIPVRQRVPFRVEESGRQLTLRLYNAVSDINWMRYGPADPYLRRMTWLQSAADEVTLTLDLGGPVWGYRTRWSGNDLVLDVRRPPRIDPRHPLAGRRIVVDPGHPPLGATGPTGLREAEANLGVALALRGLLERAGATVLLTRERDTSVDLLPRIRFADSVDADVLLSIHNNALPDGVNPFTNNGSSTFYNHPHSLPLAQAIERELVRHLGLQNLGTGRGDLALVRPTWMPAVLVEGLFMMLPDQEAALRSPEGQRRYAEAVVEGLADFLRGVATEAAGVP